MMIEDEIVIVIVEETGLEIHLDLVVIAKIRIKIKTRKDVGVGKRTEETVISIKTRTENDEGMYTDILISIAYR